MWLIKMETSAKPRQKSTALTGRGMSRSGAREGRQDSALSAERKQDFGRSRAGDNAMHPQMIQKLVRTPRAMPMLDRQSRGQMGAESASNHLKAAGSSPR